MFNFYFKLFNLMNLSKVYSIMLFLFSMMSITFSFLYYLKDLVMFIEWEVLNYNSVSVILTFLLDWVSLSFMGVVLMISSMVMYYSGSYMAHDKSFSRFIILVFMFVLSMILLILSPNMISILLGWDGLGLVSYCLVIYYQNVKSASAGLLTVLSNRIGDVAILLTISWLFNYGSWNFYFLPYMYKSMDLYMIMILVILAAMTKSAQIPFSAWLPAAMAAPTPVSSLVHSSTLVTAGVYLLIRFHELININYFLLVISVMTMFMSGVGANFEMDLKKIIALSTLSQLGVMMMILSLGMYELAYFHLITHALFKSLLFLCAGVFIHAMGDIQDIRMVSGVGKLLPITSVFFVGCSLSLCGFPFLAGFYSKDLIIETYFMNFMNYFILLMLFWSTMMTASYSIRLVYFIYGKNMSIPMGFILIKEESMMAVPMMVLFILSVFVGSLFNWLFLPIYLVVLSIFMKTLVMMCLLLIVTLTLYMIAKNEFMINFLKLFMNLKNYLGTMWFLPNLSTFMLMPTLTTGVKYLKVMDMGWLEFFGGQGINFYLMKNSSISDYWNMLGVKTYLLLMFFIFFFILIF